MIDGRNDESFVDLKLRRIKGFIYLYPEQNYEGYIAIDTVNRKIEVVVHPEVDKSWDIEVYNGDDDEDM